MAATLIASFSGFVDRSSSAPVSIPTDVDVEAGDCVAVFICVDAGAGGGDVTSLELDGQAIDDVQTNPGQGNLVNGIAAHTYLTGAAERNFPAVAAGSNLTFTLSARAGANTTQREAACVVLAYRVPNVGSLLGVGSTTTGSLTDVPSPAAWNTASINSSPKANPYFLVGMGWRGNGGDPTPDSNAFSSPLVALDAYLGTDTGRTLLSDYGDATANKVSRDRTLATAELQITSGGTSTQAGAGTITSALSSALGLAIAGSILGFEIITPHSVSLDRNRADTRLRLAYVEDLTQAVKVRLYNDQQPETVASTVTVESDGGRAVSLACRRSGEWDLFYVRGNTVYFTHSDDQGGSWSVATSIASGYQDVKHVIDERTGRMIVALYNDSADRWDFCIGTLDEDGETWTFTAPATLVSNASAGGDLKLRADGVPELAYMTTGGASSIVRARDLTASGGGSWA